MPETQQGLTQLLQNMNVASDDGHLNLAGVLLFVEQPERIKPQFVIKAKSVEVIVYEPALKEDRFFNGRVVNNLAQCLA